MHILITGGAGFIGSHIVEAFLGRGHRVTVVDNLITGKKENLHRDAAFFEADVRDAGAMARIFADGRFDAVVHEAAQMDVRKSVADPVFDASVNILGMLTLLENCVRTKVRRVVFASSGGAIYGEQNFFPADETHPTRPISPYGVAKLATEQYLFYYHAVYGLDAVCLRYANVYGPRQNPEGEAGVVAIFATKMLRGESPVINGDGKQTRDYVYVGDVVQANMCALEAPAGFQVYNVGTGVETDVNHLFHVLRHATGSACAEQHGEAKMGEQRRSVLDTGRIGDNLGWRQVVELEEGLQRTVEFFRERVGSRVPGH
jgi:UDP-glucose 4-epimerase